MLHSLPSLKALPPQHSITITFPTSRQEVESHFLIPTELLGLGILLLGVLVLLGVLLPEPPSDSLGRPLDGSRGAESFGFGGTFGLAGFPILLQLLVLWLKRPGGELPSRCIGGWRGVVEEQGVERPEEGSERSLLTGIRLDLVITPPPPPAPSPHSLMLLLTQATQDNNNLLTASSPTICRDHHPGVLRARGRSRYWRLLAGASTPQPRPRLKPSEKPARSSDKTRVATFQPSVSNKRFLQTQRCHCTLQTRS